MPSWTTYAGSMPEESILELPSTVGSSVSLARYLTHRKHIRPSTQTVSSRAFEPPSDLRLSVFRIDGLRIEEVWEIGQVNVVNAMSPPGKLYGMGSIKVFAVRDVQLDIDPDNTPPRHACIVGWPEDKFRQMSIAQELAASAILVSRSQAAS
jgi:hypothetical protein